MTVSASVVCVPGVEYTVADGQQLHLDLYVPDRPGPHPACLWLHGGAWFLGDRSSGAKPFAVGLAERGIAIASIDYRLGEAGCSRRTSTTSTRRSAGCARTVADTSSPPRRSDRG